MSKWKREVFKKKVTNVTPASAPPPQTSDFNLLPPSVGLVWRLPYKLMHDNINDEGGLTSSWQTSDQHPRANGEGPCHVLHLLALGVDDVDSPGWSWIRERRLIKSKRCWDCVLAKLWKLIKSPRSKKYQKKKLGPPLTCKNNVFWPICIVCIKLCGEF